MKHRAFALDEAAEAGWNHSLAPAEAWEPPEEADAAFPSVPSLRALLAAVRAGAPLRRSPWHGEDHWMRVAAAGLAIRDLLRPEADGVVLVLFGLLHDASRLAESGDIGHGPRAALAAGRLNAAGLIVLDGDRLDALRRACRGHTMGRTSEDPIIGTCWDADRCDLRRGGLRRDPSLLSISEEKLGAVDAMTDGAPKSWTGLLRWAQRPMPLSGVVLGRTGWP
ncbi:protein of unknown function (plasmid) [Magnetospirillum sp. XM-1]|uniref:hypothetical protein n=1 Tax=Magnetospirillum sp. XM-1 TaxID=1663591 RepID=UPI00073E076D|nr:hypothetical protein [Magnetospirillum sp. XM-1]CUW41900.1 protein of unknown function [Magnetospirillum sp. XM-1]